MHKMKRFEKFCLFLAAAALTFVSCKDTYYYDDREPEWLGSSIYDYLKEAGEFNYFVRIIDTCNYREVLAKTGSKTMFVCPDSCFESFFRNNDEGITCFDDFTQTDLKQIMEYAMINDANLIEILSYDIDYVKGQVMRRTTALDPLDLVEHQYVSPDAEMVFSKYFKPYQGKGGIYTLNDNTSPRVVQFFEAQMAEQNITDEDFSIIFNGLTRQEGDAHLFDKKVIERDITCKNGYIHVLDGLLRPQPNMAQYIRENKDLTAFNALLDRYAAPYYNESQTVTYRELHPDFPLSDSIFERRYFAAQSSAGIVDRTPDGLDITSDERLLFDPGWNGYEYNGSDKYDMAAMFVPDNQAVHDYFYKEGEDGQNVADGYFLWERYWDTYHHGEPQPSVDEAYRYWDSVPADMATMYVNAHMQRSFIKSLPSRFDGMTNSDGDDMFLKKADVKRVKVGSNGAVYVTDKLYPPIDYVSVMAPVLVGENTKVFNYALKNMSYRYYLRSMEPAYHPEAIAPFTFIVPYDGNLDYYIYPAAQGHRVKEMLKFGYDETYQTVYATRYRYDEATGAKGVPYEDAVSSLKASSIIMSETTGEIHEVLKAYLGEIMDYHIIIDSIHPDQEYYETKGKGFIRVQFADPGDLSTAQFYGGGNMEQNCKWGASKAWNDEKYRANTLVRKEFRNGVTYIVDKMLQQPLESVYTILSAQPEFNDFFKMLREVPSSDYQFFANVDKYPGISLNVPFFKAYHYTVYALDNAALAQAHADGLPSWSEVSPLMNSTDKNKKKLGNYMMQKAVNFLRYHFQDNSVYIKGYPISNQRYETAVKNNQTGKYLSVWDTQDGSSIKVVPTVVSSAGVESRRASQAVEVVTEGNLYNLMARDHFFYQSSSDAAKAVGSISDYSARTVIHQISDYLHFIRPPETCLNGWQKGKTAGTVTVSMDVSDNGDGVVYNGGIVRRRGICWSYDPHPTITDHCIDIEATDDVIVDQSVTLSDDTGKPVYIRSFVISKWNASGNEAVSDAEALFGYSDVEYCLNIKEGKQVSTEE